MLNTKTRNPADTRQKLLDTAISLMWNTNYGDVGVNEVCEKAGVTKGGFYHHFESKAQLFCAAADHYWQSVKADLDRIFSPEHDALAKLEHLIDFMIQKQERINKDEAGTCSSPFFNAGSQCSSEEAMVREASHQMLEKGYAYNVALVQALQSEGHIDEDIDLHQTARMLWYYTQGLLQYGRIHQDTQYAQKDLRLGIYRVLCIKHSSRR